MKERDRATITNHPKWIWNKRLLLSSSTFSPLFLLLIIYCHFTSTVSMEVRNRGRNHLKLLGCIQSWFCKKQTALLLQGLQAPIWVSPHVVLSFSVLSLRCHVNIFCPQMPSQFKNRADMLADALFDQPSHFETSASPWYFCSLMLTHRRVMISTCMTLLFLHLHTQA